MRELVIHFDSDWRIGTGRGVRGDVDDRVRRDPDGFPIVPARTATGMWRDGCERVAAALDGGETGPWRDWLDVVFGTQPNIGVHDRAPIPAALSVRTATLPEGLRAELARDERLIKALYAVRPGVQLESATHHPRQDHLFLRETVRSRLTLRAPIALADSGWTDAQRHTAAVLLALGAEQVRAIGGSRRRGLGRATVTLSDLDSAVVAMLKAEHPPNPAPLPAKAQEPDVAAPGAADGWVTITLRATCVDPVVSRSIATDNELRGLTYVPGGMVLPIVFAKARAAGVDLRPLIGEGGIVCEPLVPLIDGAPARPAPRCLVASKNDKKGELFNLLLGRPTGQAKPLRETWLAGEGPAVTVLRPSTSIQLHNVVDDAKQRPTSDVGGLYAYESIPAGTPLGGRVRLRVPVDAAKALAAKLTGQWRVGSAKKDDYGRVDVTATVDKEPAAAPEDSTSIVLWFVTDAVLTTENLAPVSTVDELVKAITKDLGCEVKLVPSGKETASHSVAFGRTDSWHTRWTRPRPTLVTVSAGSVITLRAENIPAAAIDKLVRDGVGERRAEGFGIVAVNDPLLENSKLISSKASETSGSTLLASSDEPDERLLEELRRHALRRDIEHRAASLPADKLKALATTPSQLANLRAALSTPDPKVTLAHFVKAIADAKVRKTRWTPNSVKELEKLADGGVWDLLKIPKEHQIADVEPWALRRVLAHLNTAGATAPGQLGDRDGA